MKHFKSIRDLGIKHYCCEITDDHKHIRFDAGFSSRDKYTTFKTNYLNYIESALENNSFESVEVSFIEHEFFWIIFGGLLDSDSIKKSLDEIASDKKLIFSFRQGGENTTFDYLKAVSDESKKEYKTKERIEKFKSKARWGLSLTVPRGLKNKIELDVITPALFLNFKKLSQKDLNTYKNFVSFKRIEPLSLSHACFYYDANRESHKESLAIFRELYPDFTFNEEDPVFKNLTKTDFLKELGT